MTRALLWHMHAKAPDSHIGCRELALCADHIQILYRSYADLIQITYRYFIYCYTGKIRGFCARYMKVTTCPLAQPVSGAKCVLSTPLVIPFSAAHAMASL